MALSRQRIAAAVLILAAGSGSYVLSQPVPDGDPFLVNVWTTDWQNQPRVAADGSGGFVIVWESYYQVSPQSSWDVFARRYDSLGQPLGGEFLVNAGTEYAQGWPAVAAFDSGGFIVTWERWSPYGHAVLARTFDSAGAPLGGEISPPTNGYYAKERPDVAAAPSGASVVTWTWDSGIQKDVFARRIDGNGVPLASEFRVNSYYRSNQGSPAVTMDTDGSFVVAWSGLHTGEQGYGIWAQRFDSAGSTLGGEIQVNAYSPGRQDLPDIAMLPDGAFVVVWRDEDRIGGSGYGVWGRRFDSGGSPLGGEFQIHTTPLRQGYDSRPRVSSDADGNFLVVWSGIVAGNNWLSILGQSFDSSGARVGGEFELVHGTPSIAGNITPDLAKAGSGELLAAWGSWDSGANSGIWARRFLPLPCSPLPGDVTDLRAAPSSEGADLLFGWTNTPGADDYVLFQDSLPGGSFGTAAGVGVDGDPGMTLPAPVATTFYLMAPRNLSCGLGPIR